MAALIALSTLFGLVAVLVRMVLGPPVLFRQTRGGLHQKHFTILKFRSINHERDADGTVLSYAVRITRLGWFLHATSLDELPELFNVPWGDMSLVGPRPLLTRHEPWYTGNELERFDVRRASRAWRRPTAATPSTGTSAFSMTSSMSRSAVLRSISKILFFTVGKVLRREDVHVDTSLSQRSLDEERSEKLSGLASSDKEREMSVDATPNANARRLVILAEKSAR